VESNPTKSFESAYMLDNPVILKKYILAPESMEYLVPLQKEINCTIPDRYPTKIEPRVVAVYKPTGRGPFRDGSREGWEFEYQGVRIVD
jgi:hypothetical protein